MTATRPPTPPMLRRRRASADRAQALPAAGLIGSVGPGRIPARKIASESLRDGPRSMAAGHGEHRQIPVGCRGSAMARRRRKLIEPQHPVPAAVSAHKKGSLCQLNEIRHLATAAGVCPQGCPPSMGTSCAAGAGRPWWPQCGVISAAADPSPLLGPLETPAVTESTSPRQLVARRLFAAKVPLPLPRPMRRLQCAPYCPRHTRAGAARRLRR